jgi:hypothetical protein
MSLPACPAPLNVGFLTILQEPTGYLGGYLVTNTWGRPLEFRLSTAVQPNRVHQILYAETLKPYICVDLIARTLVDKTSTAVQLLVTDSEPVLDLRLKVATPVVWLAGPEDPAGDHCVRPAGNGRGALLCHPRFPGDVTAVRELLERLDGNLDLTEPLSRIREAIAEARKMGVTKSA